MKSKVGNIKLTGNLQIKAVEVKNNIANISIILWTKINEKNIKIELGNGKIDSCCDLNVIDVSV